MGKPHKPVTELVTMEEAQREERKHALVKAYKRTLGNIAAACAKVGIHRSTFTNYYNTDPEFASLIDDATEEAIDFAEGKLMKLIDGGNVAATIFFLKTRAKHRGYIEGVDVTGGLTLKIEDASE